MSGKNISSILSCNKFHELHLVLPNMNCLRCRFDILAYCSMSKPCLKPLKYYLSQRFADHSDWRTIPSQFTWYLFTANHLMFPSSQFILFRIIVPSFSTFYRERNQQRHQETNRLSNTHCRNEINVERDGNETQPNIDSIYNKCCY